MQDSCFPLMGFTLLVSPHHSIPLGSSIILIPLSEVSAKASVQTRVNRADLRLLSLEKPVCKLGSWLVSVSLDLGRVLGIP